MKGEGQSILSLLKQRVFWQITLPYFICGFTDIRLMNTHYIPLSQGKGNSVGIIAFTFNLIAVVNIFGTIGAAILPIDGTAASWLELFMPCEAELSPPPWPTGPGCLWHSPWYTAYRKWPRSPRSASLCAHVFRKNSIGVVFGLVSVSHQLGGAIGSLVPGIIFDATGSYTGVFLLAVLLLGASALIVSRVPDVR